MAVQPLSLARVSTALRTGLATARVGTTQRALAEAQQQISTGKRLLQPSDDLGAASGAMRLRRALEQRAGYQTNLSAAASHLGHVDEALGGAADLVRDAQTVVSASIGTDATDEQRAGAAVELDAIYEQLIALANKEQDGLHLFGGDEGLVAPFERVGDAVVWRGSRRQLHNDYDTPTNARLPFTVDGVAAWGALSPQVMGSDAAPSLSASTRLADVRRGVGRGVVRVTDGAGGSATVDLRDADTLGDVVARLNATGLVSASVGAAGLTVNGTNVGLSDVSGTSARDLGLLTPPGGGGASFTGGALDERITPLTSLSRLRNGAGLDLAGLTITSGGETKNISFAGATTVEDVLNRVNDSGLGVRASVNAAGTGLDLQNVAQGTSMSVAENGGATAAQLGLKSFGAATPLADLNDGRGVTLGDGADLTVTNSAGVATDIDLGTAATVGDAINAINAAGAGVTASLNASGNGLVLTDTAGGAGALAATSINGTHAQLGLDVAPIGTTLTGNDPNPVAARGVFATLDALRKALRANDSTEATRQAERFADDYDRLVRARGEAGARAKDFDARLASAQDVDVATKALLSDAEDADLTEAISRFTQLQTALQASLQTTAQLNGTDLFDYLG